MCQSDGTLLMPDGVTIEGLLPPDDLDPSDAPGSVQEARAPSILPPAAERVQVAREGGFPDTQSLLAHIEERTAMVLVQGENGVGNGTGFFVGPDLLVTNYHVIEASDGGGIYVTNEAINTLVQAELVKSLGPMDQTGGDFALLRVPGVSQPNFEILASDATLRLQSVIAAGYPRDLMDTDDAFNELRNGNLQAVPSLVCYRWHDQCRTAVRAGDRGDRSFRADFQGQLRRSVDRHVRAVDRHEHVRETGPDAEPELCLGGARACAVPGRNGCAALGCQLGLCATDRTAASAAGRGVDRGERGAGRRFGAPEPWRTGSVS